MYKLNTSITHYYKHHLCVSCPQLCDPVLGWPIIMQKIGSAAPAIATAMLRTVFNNAILLRERELKHNAEVRTLSNTLSQGASVSQHI